jgi:hypothetical protein
MEMRVCAVCQVDSTSTGLTPACLSILCSVTLVSMQSLLCNVTICMGCLLSQLPDDNSAGTPGRVDSSGVLIYYTDPLPVEVSV